MENTTILKRDTILFKLSAIFLSLCLFSTSVLTGCQGIGTSGYAQANSSIYNLPSPTKLLALSEDYSYPLLKGIKFNPKDPLKLEFIIDTASLKRMYQRRKQNA